MADQQHISEDEDCVKEVVNVSSSDDEHEDDDLLVAENIDNVSIDSDDLSESDLSSLGGSDDSDIGDEEDEECEQPQSSNTPLPVKLKSQINDIAMHPLRNVFAAAEVDGKVSVHSYSTEETNKKLLEYKGNGKSCRSLSFFNQGSTLLTGFKNKTIRLTNVETGGEVKNITAAHSSPLYTIKDLTESLFASGDENGCVKVWDSRTCTAIMECSDNKDFISDMAYVEDKKTLLCTCGDGTLSVYNVGKKKLEQRSDQLDDELLALGVIKGSSKVVCAGGDGTLHIYSWNRWADVSDRFPGHPSSIDALCTLNEDTVCTGCADGRIRVVQIQPNSFVKTLGGHGKFPIERIRRSHDSSLVLTCSHDHQIRFWDVSSYSTPTLNTFDEEDDSSKPGKNRKRKLNETREENETFFADL